MSSRSSQPGTAIVISALLLPSQMVYMFETQMTANPGSGIDQRILSTSLRGKGIDMSMFDVNRTTGEISVL